MNGIIEHILGTAPLKYECSSLLNVLSRSISARVYGKIQHLKWTQSKGKPMTRPGILQLIQKSPSGHIAETHSSKPRSLKYSPFDELSSEVCLTFLADRGADWIPQRDDYGGVGSTPSAVPGVAAAHRDLQGAL